MQVQQIVNQEMLAFIKKMRPGTRMAVFDFNYRLILLQGFTSDPELPGCAAITSKRATAHWFHGSKTRGGPGDPAGPVRSAGCHRAWRTWRCVASTTLPPPCQLARISPGFPAAKTSSEFGGSFPMQMDCSDEYAVVSYDFTKDLASATDQLARAHVVLYPIDGRALDALARGKETPI